MTTPRTRSCVAASLVLFALSSVTLVAPAADAGPRRAPHPTSDELGKRMLALVNRSRTTRGLALLHQNARLSREALSHSKRMARAGVISHTPNLADLTGGDSIERLERLAALHRSGALTDEEFAAAKARLLG